MNAPTQPRGREKPPQPQSAPRSPSPMRTMDNPFLNDEEHTLPHIPDTAEWHYCYLRYRVGEKDDSQNLVRHLNGKLPYQLVSLNDLPEEQRSLFEHLKLSQGQHIGRIGINDVVLARCPQHLYRMYYEATQIRADRMNDALRVAIESKNTDRMSRSRIYVEEDSEADGLMPGRAELVN